jgi:N-acetylmuramoyl-L-alanine amidase
MPGRRYRLNGKKLMGTLLAIGFVVAVCVYAAAALKNAANAELAVIGDGIPGTTAGAVPKATQTSGSLGMPESLAETAAANTPPSQTGQTVGIEGRVIVIDAGHGGFDPGAIGAAGTHEDDLNLAVARYLKDEMEACGVQVIMTREADVGLGETQDESLQERRRIIEQSGSDIVISIHMNNYKQDPKVWGPLVLFMPGSDRGKKLAETVQQSLNTALNASGTARSENLYILKSGNQPCVLVECGYLSNEEEERKLGQPDYQKKVAAAICEGIRAYFSE